MPARNRVKVSSINPSARGEHERAAQSCTTPCQAAALDFGGNSPRRQLRQLLQNRLQFSVAGGSSRRVISRHLPAGSAQLHTARLGGCQCLLGAAS